MIALLDVGVLVALFDPGHILHEAVHTWLEENRSRGWATCPITENAFVRAVSHPDYPGRHVTVPDALERLQAFTESGDHHFWPDATSLRRASRIEAARVGGGGQLTAAYLLLLAVHQGGRLATLDRDVPVDAVRGAGSEHLAVLGGPRDSG